MKAQDCKNKTRVVGVGTNCPLRKGIVVGDIDFHGKLGQVVIVEWDNGVLEKINIRSLLLEEDGLKEELRLKNEQDRLEVEFIECQIKISEKMQQAANLIKESKALAATVNKDLTSMWDEIGPLINILEDVGWRTSSMNC